MVQKKNVDLRLHAIVGVMFYSFTTLKKNTDYWKDVTCMNNIYVLNPFSINSLFKSRVDISYSATYI